MKLQIKIIFFYILFFALFALILGIGLNDIIPIPSRGLKTSIIITLITIDILVLVNFLQCVLKSASNKNKK